MVQLIIHEHLVRMQGFRLFKIVLVLIFSADLPAQNIDIRIYDREISDREIIIFGDNNEYFPVSVELSLELKGMETSHRNGEILVLQPRMMEQPLTTLRPEPGQSWKYRSAFKSFFGDVHTEQYDSNHVYELPFPRGTSEFISQGYFGKLSHQEEYALDFDLKEGTPVHAVRAGTVVKVVDHFNKSCPESSCLEFNNFIIIQHDDGTYADYAHLKQNGAIVRAGDQVATGDPIGYSGNTGWTTGPHLHLTIFVPAVNKRKTIPTLFRIGNDTSAQLMEGQIYRRS